MARNSILVMILLLVLGLSNPGFSQQTVPSTPNLQETDQLIRQGKFSLAFSKLSAWAALSPEPAGVETRLGRVEYEKHDYGKAIQHLRLATRQNAKDAEATELLGLCYYMQGDPERAMGLLESAVPNVPDPMPTALDILGDAYLRAHQNSKARIVFARMYHVSPETARGHLVIAQMMIRQDMAGEAIPELQKAISLDPKLPMAHLLLGESYLAHSQVQLALRKFQEEIEVNPVQWLAYWRMGDAYSRLGELTQAEQALEKSIWIDPYFTGPFILLGRVELRKGDPALAVRFLQHAIKMDPNNYSAHYLLGQSYQRLGMKARANHEFDITRSLHSTKGQQ